MKCGFRWTISMVAVTAALVAGLPMYAGADEPQEIEALEGPGEQQDADEPGEEYDREDGLRFLRDGTDAFEEENFEAAYENYTKAFEVLAEPIVMYRMGETAEKLGDIRSAVEHYEHYQAIGDDEEFLDDIEASLPELRSRVPALVEITTDPAGATVTVYEPGEQVGTEVGTTPVTAEPKPGEIDIELTLEGYETERVELALESGDEQVVDRQLTASTDPAVAEPIDAPDAEPEGELGLWGWTSTGLGAAIVAFGGVMSFFQHDTTQQVNEFDRAAHSDADADQRDQLRTDQERLRGDAESYYRAAMGSYIAGGLLTAAGLGMLMYDGFGSGDDDGEISLRWSAGFGGGIVGIEGRY